MNYLKALKSFDEQISRSSDKLKLRYKVSKCLFLFIDFAFFQVDGSEFAGDNMIVRLGAEPNVENVEMYFDCVAVQARCRPVFKWFIGSTEIDVSDQKR